MNLKNNNHLLLIWFLLFQTITIKASNSPVLEIHINPQASTTNSSESPVVIINNSTHPTSTTNTEIAPEAQGQTYSAPMPQTTNQVSDTLKTIIDIVNDPDTYKTIATFMVLIGSIQNKQDSPATTVVKAICTFSLCTIMEMIEDRCPKAKNASIITALSFIGGQCKTNNSYSSNNLHSKKSLKEIPTIKIILIQLSRPQSINS